MNELKTESERFNKGSREFARSIDGLKIEFAELARMSRLRNTKCGNKQVMPLGISFTSLIKGNGILERIDE